MSALKVYTTSWCPFCQILRADLDRAGIAYEEIDIEAHPEAAAVVESHNNGNRTVPTVVFADGTALTNPPLEDVVARLG